VVLLKHKAELMRADTVAGRATDRDWQDLGNFNLGDLSRLGAVTSMETTR
jgi:hypothetical protein